MRCVIKNPRVSFAKVFYIALEVLQHVDFSREIGAWLSLVEHRVRDAGAGGSNPLAPTNQSKRDQPKGWSLFLCCSNSKASPFVLRPAKPYSCIPYRKGNIFLFSKPLQVI